MEKLLSIIIPMYNVEPYIYQCLDSLCIEQIFDNIEVLVIDDGSSDRSPEIAEQFVQKYPQVFRVLHKENGGHGSTINLGIEETRGIYFKVLDGDDWIDQAGFVSLIHLLKQYIHSPADMIFSNYVWVDHSTGEKKHEVKEICPGAAYEKIYDFDFVADKIFFKMHAVTYRTQILKNMPLRLDEHCFYVDMEYLIYPLPYIKRVVFLSDDVYQYRVGLPSQSMSISNMKKRCGQHEQVLKHLIAYYGTMAEGAGKKASASILARMLVSQYKIYLNIGKEKKGALIEWENLVKTRYPEIYLSVNNAAVRLLRKSGYRLYGAGSLAVALMP